jgi:hypothetical protein
MARPVTRDLPASQARIAEIRKLLDAGLSKRAVARSIGVSVMTVSRAIALCVGTLERPKVGPFEGSTVETFQHAEGEDDGYPEALRRRVAPDFVAILPPAHYRALVAAATGSRTAAAAESLRQALLLHGEPLVPPPTSIELALSVEEEEERRRGGEEEQGRASATF